MKNMFGLWKGIITSPINGFEKLDRKTGVALPLLFIILLMLAAYSLLIPVMSSQAYTEALTRTQLTALAEKGQPVTDEQRTALSEQFMNPTVRTITLVTSVAGGVIGLVIMLFVQMLFIKLVTMIFGTRIEFRLIMRIVVFISLITAVQLIIKNTILVTSNYERVMRTVLSTSDLQYALSAPISLAMFFSPKALGPVLYMLVDSLTDIFSWLYYGFLYAGLRGAAGIKHSKALGITIASALLFTGIGLLTTILM